MKATEPTLSRHLMVEARKFAGYPNRVRKGRRTGELVANLLKAATVQREWIGEYDLAFLAGASTETRLMTFDEYYTKDLLERIPGMAARTELVPPVLTRTPVSRSANLYLREATQGYIRGVWDSAVALSRAALEEALQDRVCSVVGPLTGLNDLIDAAERKLHLHRDAIAAARRLKQLGNDVLHERHATEGEALAAVRGIRLVLQHLYGTRS